MVIENNFEGWIPVDEKYVAFSAKGFILHIFSPDPDFFAAKALLNRFISQNSQKGEYIQAQDTGLHRVAFLNSTNALRLYEPSSGLFLSTPIIIKSSGNTDYFYKSLTRDWEVYDAITFWGGNVNTIRNPKRAILDICKRDDKDYFTGANTINVKPFSERIRRIPVAIRGINAEMVISSFCSDLEYESMREIAYVDSSIKFAFDRPQKLNSITEYINDFKCLIALFSRHSNVKFETTVLQKTNAGLFNQTAICKVYDGHNNYLEEFRSSVLQIDDILNLKNGEKILINIIHSISNDEIQHIKRLFIEDNDRHKWISVDDVGFLCSALEVECDKSLEGTEKNSWIEGLKEAIKQTISAYERDTLHSNVYNETNISSCFQYLNYTLKNRIFSLYQMHKSLIDQFNKQKQLPAITVESIGNFVKIRNKSAHEGNSTWNGGEKIYYSLLYLTYVSFFRRAGMSEEDISSLLGEMF